jgi:hypothetical protein
MSRAEDAASDLSLSLRRLGMSSNEAEEEIDSAGRSASTTAVQFSGLTGATNTTTAAFKLLSITTVGTLVPALFTLGAALTPVIAALGGFVAIAGAIGAVGIAGVLGGIAAGGERLKWRFMEVVGTLQDAFRPAMEVAAEVLFSLLNAFDRIIWELVPAQETVTALAAQFEALGMAVIEALPAFVDLALTLATEFLPPFVRFVENILPQVPGLVQTAVSFFRELSPMFADAAASVRRLIPPLLEFGMTALPIIANALGTLTGWLRETLVWFNSLGQGAQDVGIAFSLIAPVISGLATVFVPLLTTLSSAIATFTGFSGILSATAGVLSTVGSAIAALVSGPVLIVVGAIAALAAAWQRNFGGIQDSTDAAVNRISQSLQKLQPVFRGFREFYNQFVKPAIADLQSAARTTANILGTVLQPAITATEVLFGASFDAMTGIVSGAVDLMIDLIRTFSRLLSGRPREALGIFAQSLKDVLIGAVEFIGEWRGIFIQEMTNAIIGAIQGLSSIASDVLGIDVGLGDEQVQAIRGQSESLVQRQQEQANQVIREIQEVRIVPSDQFETEQRQVAENVVNEQQRSTRRRQGRAGYDV